MVTSPSKLQTALLASVLAASVSNAASAQPKSGTEKFDRQMQPILASYLKIGDRLAADSIEDVSSESEVIVKLAPKLDPKSVTGEHATHYQELPSKIEDAARTLSKAKGLEKAREAYKELSMPLSMWATMSKPDGIDVVYCDMAKASWLQKKGPIHNPYYGSKMLRCGDVVKSK